MCARIAHRTTPHRPELTPAVARRSQVATFGEDKYDAILTSMLSTNFKIPKQNVYVCIGPLHAKLEFLPAAKDLIGMGLTVWCSPGTHAFFVEHGLKVCQPRVTVGLTPSLTVVTARVSASVLASVSAKCSSQVYQPSVAAKYSSQV